jgi:ankyrin repeat protein
MPRFRELDDHDGVMVTFAEKKTTTLPAGFTVPQSTRLEVEESKVYTPVLSIPNLPVIQPYNPTDGGLPVYTIAMKMPGLVNHIPTGIADLLAEHGVTADNLDIGLVAQSNNGKKAIFRPHAWLHKDAPRTDAAGYSVKTADVLVGTCSVGTSPILFKPTHAVHTHTIGAGKTMAFSPDNLGIDGLNDDGNLAMYSVVIDESMAPPKAVVTLHVLCNPVLNEKICVVAGEDEPRTYSQVIDALLAIDDVVAQPQLTAALNTFRDGTPIPSHSFSGNTHSLQDSRPSATALLVAQIGNKGFDLSSINTQNAEGMTPLTYCVEKKNMDCIRACLAKGANPEINNGAGKSALGIAEEAGDTTIVEMLKSTIESNKNDKLYRFCTKYGFDFYNLERENAYRVTPVTVAASHNNEEILETLLERNVHIYKPNSHGNTPFKIALSKGFGSINDILNAHSLSIIARFAERYGFDQYDLDVENAHNVTMLTVAVEKNMPEVVHALVENGANVGLANSWGKTPISIAERAGFAGMKAYLESKLEAPDLDAPVYRACRKPSSL